MSRLVWPFFIYWLSVSFSHAYALSVNDLMGQAKSAAYQVMGKTVALKSFSPQGDVGSVGQARARFSEDMVRVGDKNVRNPFFVSESCKNYGSGRWLDTKTWIYHFSSQLPVGVICEFKLVAGLKNVQGKPVSAFPNYRFKVGDVTFGYDRSVTQAVRVIDSWPRHQGDILDDQVFLIKLDKSTDTRSLPNNVYCLTSDSPEKLFVKFFTPAETTAWIAKQDKVIVDWWRGQKSDEYYINDRSVQDTVVEWRALSCGRRLTAGQDVRLIFGKNVASSTNVKRSSDQVLAYKVRQPFTVSFSCPRQNAKAPCVPLTDMEVRFSEMVTADKLKAIRLQGATKVWTPVPNNGDAFEDGYVVRFAAPFPANSAFILSLPSGINDVFARPLSNAKSFPLQVKTGDYPPLAKFAADFGVVETAVGAVPVTVRNIEPSLSAKTEAKLYSLKIADDELAIVKALKNYSSNGNYGILDKSLITKEVGVTVQPLPKQLTAKEFEVIGIPVSNGLYIHEIESRYLGEWISQKPQSAFVHSMSLVTNLGVHVQMGKASGLIWVTDLAKGQPVANASVSVWDCVNSKQLWTGQTNAQGTVKVSKDVFKEPDYPQNMSNVTSCQNSSWVIFAKSGNDRSFALSEWSNGIETWRYNFNSGSYYDEGEYYGEMKSTGDYIGHTIFDRSLLRVGETVHMQHLVRYAKLSGLSAPNKDFSVKKIIVEHSGSGEQFEVAASFNAIGNGDSEWKIPKNAKLGDYCARLEIDNDQTLYTGCFKVAAFRLPVLKADLGLPLVTTVNNTNTLPMQLQLRYLSGGGYSNAPVKVRGRVSSTWPRIKGFEEFYFNSVPLTALNKTEENQSSEVDLEEQALTLDGSGALNIGSAKLPKIQQVSTVNMEMEFRDPSGETQTVGATSTVWPASVLVGSRVQSSWLGAGEPVKVEFITVNQQQQAAPNTPITIKGEMIRYDTHRKRTLGGYYSYDTTPVKTPIAVNCGTHTNAQGRLLCVLPLKTSGELQLTAISTDAQGQQAATQTSVWVGGGDDWWFDQGNDDRIDVIADKKNYQTGDVAHLQVRMPFREATALVAVERDGIMESFVVPLSGKEPVVDVPIKGEYSPNIYVSVFVVRGRSNDIQATALVDLGKPAFKMGIAELKVGWEGFKLGVDVSTDKTVYHPKEQAQVTVKVSPAKDRSELPANTEITLAVVDEALLELADNKSWDVLPSMMLERAYGINTATNQLQVVGKRHFGKKALPSGGGGGRGGSTRELFDTLLLWQASAPVDAQGFAHFTVPINDSLTSFKVVAIASSREQFGTGSQSFRSSQEVQVLSGLPLTVRDGDNYQAEFTVRNSSEQADNIDVTVDSPALKTPFKTRLTLAANSSQLVTIPVIVPRDMGVLTWQISAQGQQYSDKLKVSQKVLPSVPLQLLQTTLIQLQDQPFSEPIASLPANALEGSQLQIDVQPNLGGTLGPVKKWFSYYPYACLEQKTTAAAGLQDKSVWSTIMGDLPTYLDKDGLAKFYPSEGESAGSSFLTAHILRLAKALQWPIPEDSRNKMLDALQAYAEHRLDAQIYRYWIYEENFDAVQRQLEVASILAQYGRFKPTLLDNLRLEPAKWPNHILIDWLELLQAAPNVPKRAERLAQVHQLLKAQLVQSGGTMMRLKNSKERWWWYDSNELLQARLILAVLNDKAWQEELPLMVRGLLGYQQHGHWQGTQSNLWGGIVFTRFNNNSPVVSGVTTAQVGTIKAPFTWPSTQAANAGQQSENNPNEPDLMLAWPKQASTLTVEHQGTGKPWVRISAAARVPITKTINKGFSITKTIVPVTQKVKGEWHIGDVMRIELNAYSQQDMGWVVVNDPIPSGAVLLGRGLKRDSQLLDTGTNKWWPVYVEYAADAYRAYYEYLPYKASWQNSYTLRLNQAGEFQLPVTRVEAMYAPDVYGLKPNDVMVVKP